MVHLPLVIRTKLIPPRLTRRILHRPRLTGLLMGALEYRLTLLQAGAGYGKSTALSTLPEVVPTVWYHLSSEDCDPLVFFLHLLRGLDQALPGLENHLLPLLEGEGAQPWPAVVDSLANLLAENARRPLLVILDDVHSLSEAPEVLDILDRLVGRSPHEIHFLLSSRYPVRLASLVGWRVKGEVLSIGQTALAFTREEIATLFAEHYGLSLSSEQVARLAQDTEGWAIALQLYWQGFKSGAFPAGQRSGQEPSGLENLFAFLAQEVLDKLLPEVKRFVHSTAVLRELSASLCDCLRGESDSAGLIRFLVDNSLFLVDLGSEAVRYHHLFREFVLRTLDATERAALHRKAARCYLDCRQDEEAIYHLRKAGDFPQMADVVGRIGEGLVRAGRLETLNHWIGALPPEVLESSPLLLVYLGDVARLRSRFEEALGWYRQAEERSRALGEMRWVSLALHGQARVYLDTVNPSQAEQLLQESLRLTDGTDDRENRARLLELLSENRLNSGRLEEAERYRDQARALREMGPVEMELSVRVLLRTGRLAEARRLLEQHAEEEHRAPVLRPRAHRETLLLLSLIHSLTGDSQAAYDYAVKGTERGRTLQSPFITAVGMMRQGHAWQLKGDPHGYEEACRCYQATVDLAENLEVPRLKVEALWGFCRAHGFRGEIDAALEAARQGLEQGFRAGDEWISALIQVSMGGGFALSGRFTEALEWLDQARARFHQVSDPFGETVCRLWQCWVWWQNGDMARLELSLDEALRAVRDLNYECLVTRCTLIGLPDPHSLIPLLIHARQAGRQRGAAESLLEQLGLSGIEHHPGYQLRIQTLGQFRVWRGKEEVGVSEWRREKARQLLQLLVTCRRAPLERDQLVERLWPGSDSETGARNLKVAMSTLLRVLEPDHTREAPSAIIAREGSLYSLRPNADIWLDVEKFERLASAGSGLSEAAIETRIGLFHQALQLYQGEYLPDCLYEDWAGEERERLLALYLETASSLAADLSRQKRWLEVIEVAKAILLHDDCWEEAYRFLMQAYMETGNRAQAQRIYKRCLERLEKELGARPSLTTVRLAETLFSGHSPGILNL